MDTISSDRMPTLRERTGDADIRIGAILREQRTLAGRSQISIANALGISFQQVQKYERGVNRIGAGTLELLAAEIGCPIFVFFGDSPAEAKNYLAHERETLELMQSYNRLGSEARSTVRSIARLLSSVSSI